MEAHGARILLLAQDCADLNPLKLRHAAIRWAKHKPFLPKASELHFLVEDMESAEWREQNSTESLQIWCDEANGFAKRIGADWWHRVSLRREDERRVLFVEKMEGWRAVEERNRFEGRRTDWYKATPEDCAAIHAHVSECLVKGMTQAQFNSHVRRTGGAPRPTVQPTRP